MRNPLRPKGKTPPGAQGVQPSHEAKPEGLAASLLKLIAVFLLPVAFMLAVVPTGYLLEDPGSSLGLQDSLHVEGAETYPVQGEFLLTSVRLRNSTLIQHIRSLLGGDLNMLKLKEYFGEELQVEEQDLVDELLTILSEDTAVVVGLRETEIPVEVEELGVMVVWVEEGYPADGILKPGEVIVAVDGQPAGNGDALRDLVSAAGTEEEIELEIREINSDLLGEESGESGKEAEGSYEEWRASPAPDADPAELLGEEKTVRLRPVWDEELGRAVIGVSLRDYFSYQSEVAADWDLEDVKGPSAGLMMTLSFINALTPEDLTGGKRIAGTGEILLDGDVGPIGGLPAKIASAEKGGAEAFIYPVENEDELEGVTTSLRLYPVDNLQDALDILEKIR